MAESDEAPRSSIDLPHAEFDLEGRPSITGVDDRVGLEARLIPVVQNLVRLTGSPIARLNRAVAVGEADDARAGLAALAGLDPALPRHAAVSAYLHERSGDRAAAARLYAEAAARASNLAERDT